MRRCSRNEVVVVMKVGRWKENEALDQPWGSGPLGMSCRKEASLMTRSRILCGCLLALCLESSGTIHGQNQVPRFRVESDVVLVDFIATDRNGDLVADLKPQEVQVFEDGKRQDIRLFRLERRGGWGREDQATGVSDRGHDSLGETPEGAATPAQRGYFAFLLDLQAMDHNSVERCKESIREFLRSEIDAGHWIMLATIRPGFRVDQSFTRDLTKLERALDQISFRRKRENLAEFVAGLLEGRTTRISPREYLDILTRQVDLSSRALSALSRHLGSLPGRKQVLYFSNGYPLNATLRIERILAKVSSARSVGRGMPVHLGSPVGSRSHLFSTTRELTRKLTSAVDRANRNQVSVHSIDPRGLMVVPIELSPVLEIADLEASHEFLATLSKDTGGLLATNENDLLRPIRRAYRDGQVYYLLSYVPNTKRKVGKFHEIAVRVKRKGLRVRHRRGYVDQDPLVVAESELTNAFKFPDLFRDFPFGLDVVRKGGKLAVRARVPTKALRFVAEGKTNRCVLEIFGVVFDELDQPTGKKFFLTKSVNLDFDVKGMETFLGYESFGPWTENVFPEKGSRLVVVLRQTLTGELAAAGAALPRSITASAKSKL